MLAARRHAAGSTSRWVTAEPGASPGAPPRSRGDAGRQTPPHRSPRTIAAVPVAAMVRHRLPPGWRLRISSGSRGSEGRSAEPIAQPDARRAGEPAAEPPWVELVRFAPSRQRNGFEPGAKREHCCRVRITPVASEHVAEDVVHGAQPQPLRMATRRRHSYRCRERIKRRDRARARLARCRPTGLPSSAAT